MSCEVYLSPDYPLTEPNPFVGVEDQRVLNRSQVVRREDVWCTATSRLQSIAVPSSPFYSSTPHQTKHPSHPCKQIFEAELNLGFIVRKSEDIRHTLTDKLFLLFIQWDSTAQWDSETVRNHAKSCSIRLGTVQLEFICKPYFYLPDYFRIELHCLSILINCWWQSDLQFTANWYSTSAELLSHLIWNQKLCLAVLQWPAPQLITILLHAFFVCKTKICDLTWTCIMWLMAIYVLKSLIFCLEAKLLKQSTLYEHNAYKPLCCSPHHPTIISRKT